MGSLILLDTHALIWLGLAPERLSRNAGVAISAARATDGVAISGETLWEVAHLASLNRIALRSSLRETLAEVERNFTILPITAAVAEQAVLFTREFPKDPADRIIGATALVNALQLVTADEAIRASGEVSCIW